MSKNTNIKIDITLVFFPTLSLIFPASLNPMKVIIKLTKENIIEPINKYFIFNEKPTTKLSILTDKANKNGLIIFLL